MHPQHWNLPSYSLSMSVTLYNTWHHGECKHVKIIIDQNWKSCQRYRTPQKKSRWWWKTTKIKVKVILIWKLNNRINVILSGYWGQVCAHSTQILKSPSCNPSLSNISVPPHLVHSLLDVIYNWTTINSQTYYSYIIYLEILSLPFLGFIIPLNWEKWPSIF